MKMPFVKLPMLILFCSTLIFCKTKNSATKANENKSEIVSTDKYNLVISFFSIGTGVDYKIKKEFDEMTIKFEEKTKKKISIESFPWGREGEVDLCINLSNLTKQESKDFIAETKKLLSPSKLVRIEENIGCKRKNNN